MTRGAASRASAIARFAARLRAVKPATNTQSASASSSESKCRMRSMMSDGAVRDAAQPEHRVVAWLDEPQLGDSHVLHRAHGPTNVHRILRLEEHYRYTGEDGHAGS